MANQIRYADRVLPSNEPGASGKQYAPAADRNKEPIGDVLLEYLGPKPTADESSMTSTIRVLELASGTGQHAVHFTRLLPRVYWQPTDCDEPALVSIAAHRDDSELDEAVRVRIAPPARLDVSSWPADLPDGSFDAVLAVNVTHISAWECTLGLLAGAGRVLRPSGPASDPAAAAAQLQRQVGCGSAPALGDGERGLGYLFIYGPFLVDGKPTTDSNAAFDAKLKGMDARYGLRDVAVIQSEAAKHGLEVVEALPMPSNNFMLIFQKQRK